MPPGSGEGEKSGFDTAKFEADLMEEVKKQNASNEKGRVIEMPVRHKEGTPKPNHLDALLGRAAEEMAAFLLKKPRFQKIVTGMSDQDKEEFFYSRSLEKLESYADLIRGRIREYFLAFNDKRSAIAQRVKTFKEARGNTPEMADFEKSYIEVHEDVFAKIRAGTLEAGQGLMKDLGISENLISGIVSEILEQEEKVRAFLKRP